MLQSPERRHNFGSPVFVRVGNRDEIGHGCPPFRSSE